MERSGKQQFWEDKWSAADFSPPWKTDKPPDVVAHTILTGGFSPAGKVLDIGCGDGANSAWVARQGFSVLGIDFAHAAIRKAERSFGDVANLKFKATDICGPVTELGQFDALFDLGCLHTIPLRFHQQYAENVADLSKPNATFLLIYKTPPEGEEAVSVARKKAQTQLGTLLKPSFDLKEIKHFVMQKHDDADQRWKMPCMAIWMVRK